MSKPMILLVGSNIQAGPSTTFKDFCNQIRVNSFRQGLPKPACHQIYITCPWVRKQRDGSWYCAVDCENCDGSTVARIWLAYRPAAIDVFDDFMQQLAKETHRSSDS